MRRTAERLRELLINLDYTVEEVSRRIGEAGQSGLLRNSTVLADRALAGAQDRLAVLVRLWLLQQPVTTERAQETFGDLLESLCAHEILARDEDSVRALVDVRPYASDDAELGWVVSDLVNGLDSIAGPQSGAYVLGISPASTSLAQLTPRDRVRRALDLGAGCGVQTLHLARHADEVIATDLNPRANELAAWTFALSGIDTVEQRLGSLWEPVAGERFDLIVTNPPYVMSPPDGERLVYREGSLPGDGLVEQIVRGAGDHLTPGGSLQVLGNWAITDPDRWTERLAEWVPEGCEAWFIERERLAPGEYIEIWLADAGLLGSSDYVPRYQRWLDYFDQLGITAVGMGWIQVTRSEVSEPLVRIEQWPHAVAQPVASALAQLPQAAAYARLDEPEIWASNWRLTEGIDQETIGEPGASDPRHVVLRSRRGLCRAVEVDTALGGVLGACDGELPLGVVSDAVAGLLEVDAAELRAELLPRIRDLLEIGMLVR